VFWWFERDGAFVRCETRDSGDAYELRITEPDGAERVERCGDASELMDRQIVLEKALTGQGWSGPHGSNH
jgi:hypothetical protein